MSTITETRSSLEPVAHSRTETHLNTQGQVVLTGIASIFANTIAHPIYTIKSRRMAGQNWNQSLAVQGIYGGYLVTVVGDWAAYGSAYLIKERTEDSLGPHFASFAATLGSVAMTGVTEGLTANRQVNGFNYAQSLKAAFRPSGIFATFLKELPYNWALLAAAPALQSRLAKLSQGDASPFMKITHAFIAGGAPTAAAGFLTTPLDLIRTRVQSSQQELSIRSVIRQIVSQDSYRTLAKGSGLRALYCGAFGGLTKIVYDSIPSHLPSSLKAPG